MNAHAADVLVGIIDRWFNSYELADGQGQDHGNSWRAMKATHGPKGVGRKFTA
jgi:hypothetical protein